MPGVWHCNYSRAVLLRPWLLPELVGGSSDPEVLGKLALDYELWWDPQVQSCLT